MDILKRNKELAVPCRTGEIFQKGQPLSTAVHKAVGDLRRASRQKSSEENEARDTDPDAEARLDFWKYHGRDYIFMYIYVSESCCSKDGRFCDTSEKD